MTKLLEVEVVEIGKEALVDLARGFAQEFC